MLWVLLNQNRKSRRANEQPEYTTYAMELYLPFGLAGGIQTFGLWNKDNERKIFKRNRLRIKKAEAHSEVVREREDAITKKILKLQKQKNMIENEKIMRAFKKSGKSYSQLMTFLGC